MIRKAISPRLAINIRLNNTQLLNDRTNESPLIRVISSLVFIFS